jgi:predicted nucleic acid-binding protein
MEWVRKLHGKVVGLDSAPLIYFVEEHPAYLPLLDPFFASVDRGEIEVVTSALTISEVLVHPIRHANLPLARQYSEILLKSAHLRTIAVSPEIAADAAELRATGRLRTPDAIQLATARSAGAGGFLTNDAGLAAPHGMQLILLDDLLAIHRP